MWRTIDWLGLHEDPLLKDLWFQSLMVLCQKSLATELMKLDWAAGVDSFVDYNDTQYNSKMSSVIPKGAWRKGSQVGDVLYVLSLNCWLDDCKYYDCYRSQTHWGYCVSCSWCNMILLVQINRATLGALTEGNLMFHTWLILVCGWDSGLCWSGSMQKKLSQTPWFSLFSRTIARYIFYLI